MKQALLLVDIQNNYFEGGKSKLHNPLLALSNIEKTLKLFRKKGFPIIHVQHINNQEGAAFFLSNTDGVRIHQYLAPLENEYLVIKHTPNSFFGTNLADILKENEIQDIVVCGMMSYMCIDTTVRACKHYGIRVTLLDDACATKDLSYNGKTISAEVVHNTFMASLNGMFAYVIKTNELSVR